MANLAVCAGLVAVLSAGSAGNAAPTAFVPGATTTEAPATPRTRGPGSEFVEVTGPGGMTTRLPAGWPTKWSTAPGAMQADDPADTAITLRFGGSATPAADLYDRHAAHEREFAVGKQAYVPIRLERTLVRGRPAVDWEYEYEVYGVPTHVRSVHWLADGHEYFVQVSAPEPHWPRAEKILEVMLTYSTP